MLRPRPLPVETDVYSLRLTLSQGDPPNPAKPQTLPSAFMGYQHQKASLRGPRAPARIEGLCCPASQKEGLRLALFRLVT